MARKNKSNIKQELSAPRLRLMLLVGMGLALVAIVAIVIFGVRFLDSYAVEVNDTVQQSTGSNERLALIRNQVDELSRNTEAVKRAKQIVAESQSYRYQDVIINDLRSFASRAGLQISDYDFTSGNGGDGQAADTAAEPAPEAAAGDMGGADASEAGAADPASQAPASQLKSTFVNITLQDPIDYRNLLQFIYYIEQNLTKMQISNISLSRSQENPRMVTSDSLTIEVYIR